LKTRKKKPLKLVDLHLVEKEFRKSFNDKRRAPQIRGRLDPEKHYMLKERREEIEIEEKRRTEICRKEVEEARENERRKQAGF